jgi:zinc/manganese transport system permease protein
MKRGASCQVRTVMRVGVLIVSTQGNNVDLLHVLFGTVLSLNDDALLLLGGLSSATLLGLAVLYRPLVMECLDPAFLRQVSRWSPVAHYGFLGLLVINLVACFHALGTLMSVGLLVLPAASARVWVRTLGAMLVLAAALALLGCTLGLLLSFHADWPSGPSIVLCLGLIYLLSLVLGRQGLYPRRNHTHRKG